MSLSPLMERIQEQFKSTFSILLAATIVVIGLVGKLFEHVILNHIAESFSEETKHVIKLLLDNPWGLAVASILLYCVLLVAKACAPILKALLSHTEHKDSPLAKPSVALPDKKVYETIDFRYLPNSPLENGWKDVSPWDFTEKGQERFSTEPNSPGGLRVQAPGRFCMELMLPEHVTLCDYIEFTAKYQRQKDNDPVIYAGIDVTSIDGRQSGYLYVNFRHGYKRPHVSNVIPKSKDGRALPEVTFWLEAKVLDDGWMLFTVPLRDVVAKSIGDQGWIWASVWAIRLRGSLSIKPIKFASERLGSAGAST